MSGSESQTSKQTSIPQEIIDQFIDHLHNNGEALKTCALVCRAWVPSSRYHLFGDVDIWVFQHDRFSNFIGHLDHPLCTFAPSVRELGLSTSTSTADGSPLHLQADGFGPDWADPLIPYLAKLTSVKSLLVHKIGGRTFGWKPLFKSASFVAQITRLSLLDPEFMTFEDCMDTIHHFPSLESLEYCPSDYDQRIAPSVPAFQGSPPPSLRTLNTVSFSPTTHWQLLWQWFHRSQTRLSAIKLGGLQPIFISAAKLSSFAQYLQFLGPSLEVLQGNFGAAPTICGFLVDHPFE
jgi:hypothetical protein